MENYNIKMIRDFLEENWGLFEKFMRSKVDAEDAITYLENFI